MDNTDTLLAIESRLTSLPDGFSGCHETNGRIMTVTKGAAGITLQLQISLRDSTLGEPLLHAQVRWPAGTSGAPAISSLRRLSQGQFHGKEHKYLAALLGWARECLAGPIPVALQPVRSPPWERHLRAFINALAADKGGVARAFFKARRALLSAQEDHSRVLDAACFLRDQGLCIHVDWKETGLFALCAQVLMTIPDNALRPAADCLAEHEDFETLEDAIRALAQRLADAGIGILELPTGDDSHIFLVGSPANLAAASRAAARLGVELRLPC